jgi:hypothetical protein
MGLSCTYKTNPSRISQSDEPHTPQHSVVIQEPETPASDVLCPEIPIFSDSLNDLVISNTGLQIEDILRSISSNTLPQDRVNFCV